MSPRSRAGAAVEPDELELNMTPMIDIVFQLIVFFLLSLKFKSIDRRIESMLPDKGRLAPEWIPKNQDKIKIKMFRRDLADRERAYTLLAIDNAARYPLPAGWRGRRVESPERVRGYDAVLAGVREAIAQRVAVYGGMPDAIVGEIVAPPPRGGSVPHGDAVAVLDAFLQAGITNVEFEGSAHPR